MGVCASAPQTVDQRNREENKIFRKKKLRVIRAETSNLPAPSQVELSNDDKGPSDASFLIKSEGGVGVGAVHKIFAPKSPRSVC